MRPLPTCASLKPFQLYHAASVDDAISAAVGCQAFVPLVACALVWGKRFRAVRDGGWSSYFLEVTARGAVGAWLLASMTSTASLDSAASHHP